MINKKGATFGTIVAVIGAILIALGVAWLIAQNWHQIPDMLKVVILLFFVSLAYVFGIILREKDYSNIAKALFVVGALLFTLSVFLIAQIFSTGVTIQGISWLLLICWLGVTFTAYFFTSYTSLIIALIEFLFWVNFQFVAFVEKTHNFPSIGYFAFLLLIAGVFFYGLGLLHRAGQHKFAKLFQWWTAFYFLAFVYVLSFQMILPLMWEGETISASLIIFLSVFGAISLIALLSGIFISIDKKSVPGKEILIFLGVILVLISLIAMTGLASGLTGTCYPKSCYNFNTQSSCSSAPGNLDCEWINNQCSEKNCYNYRDKTSCEANSNTLGCKWINTTYRPVGKCERIDCYSLQNQTSCLNVPSKLNCVWTGNTCNQNFSVGAKAEIMSPYGAGAQTGCGKYNNKKDDCKSHSECNWQASSYIGGIFGKKSSVPGILWFVWIVINIFFILLILAVIGYGSLLKSPTIINLGIIAFALDIITRYIGFIMDLWGYTTMAMIFITGGIILIFGGWLIERWRRKLVKEVREQSNNQ